MTRAIAIACIFGMVAGCKDGTSSAPTDRGRLRLVYEIDVDKAVDDKTADMRRDLEAALADARLSARVTASETGTLIVTPGDGANKQAITALAESTLGDSVVLRDCPDPRDTCFKIATSYADTVKKTALSSAADTIRERLAAGNVDDSSVAARAGQIVVELPGTDTNLVETRSLIARTGKLELQVVDDGSAYMKRVWAHVRDAGAAANQITAEVDQWRAEDGTAHTDYYLAAPDREATLPAARAQQLGCLAGRIDNGQVRCTLTGRAVLESYLAELAAKDPSFRIPDDHQIGYELVEPARDRRPAWRTYYLERAVRLTGASISNAVPAFDPDNRPIVIVDFNRFGARTFGDLTAQIVGRKLATLFDGRIISAAIISAPIRGGRVSITLGGGDASRQQTARDELVRVLKSGALPSPLRLSTQTAVP